ncbi:Dpy-30_motif-containing protein [Hexamita inflata]|uniref:Dpy-30 motif-containing protein n=1 Tax=Hexamita inflata TaxID=28002 RepID=A0AA86QYL3_9EUKA|nr:Dpy-30 motif-containing protein [Hexamita inflata]CAI9944295.1 Dpy-30 motif-containing protein [Hexamita inflata]CAI9963621.1 Dpy-30 motif-containing protein [Hexamita inflata]
MDEQTTAYLTQAVGEQLSNALAEAICRKPADAIEFIGNYLTEVSATVEK